MNQPINKQDIRDLAKLSCSVVNELDFPTMEKADASSKDKFLSMLDDLDARYGTSELLFDARAAVASRPLSKIELYLLTRKLVRLALAQKPRLVTESEGPVLSEIAWKHVPTLAEMDVSASKVQ